MLSRDQTNDEPAVCGADDAGRSMLKSERQTDSSGAASRSAYSEQPVQINTNGSVEITGANKQRQLPVVSQG
jgi:hypothetical protein